MAIHLCPISEVVSLKLGPGKLVYVVAGQSPVFTVTEPWAGTTYFLPPPLQLPVIDMDDAMWWKKGNKPKSIRWPLPVNILGFCKCLLGNVWQRLKNDGYENHL